MNHAIIAGHLGADPEVRFTSSGQKVTTFRVAAKVRRGGKEETIWWRVTVWGDQFDKILSFFKKGSAVIVFGELSKPEIFTDRNGQPQVSMNVTAFNLTFSPFGRPTDQTGSQAHEAHGAAHSSSTDMAYAAADQIMQGQSKHDNSFHEDEIPF